MKALNKSVSIVRKIAGILVGLITIGICAFFWYRGGIMIVSDSYRQEEVSVHSIIYGLNAGDNVRQGFHARDGLLTGIDVMLVNTSEDSEGNLGVQILDMWGEVIAQTSVPLSQIEPGVYVTIPIMAELDSEQSEEFQICLFSEGVTEGPGVLIISDQEDFEDNTLCYYNEDLVGDQGLVVGYNYGYEKFLGYQYQDKTIVTMTIVKIVMVILAAIIIVYLIFYFRFSKIKDTLLDYQIYMQLSGISAFVSLFLFAAIINKMDTAIRIPMWVYPLLPLPAVLFAWAFWLYLKASREGKAKRRKTVKWDRYPIILLGICVLPRLLMFAQMQRWDGGVYYASLITACTNFDFTFQSVWNYFRLASHPTIFYVFFMLMGEFLFPGKVIGIEIVSLIMTAAAMLCIYQMLQKYWCHMKAAPAVILTGIISIAPLFLGTFSYANVDYTLILFFIFLVYANYKEQKIMMAFWTLALIFNKETGWMIVAGYYLVYFVKLWKTGKGQKTGQKFTLFFSDGIVRMVMFGVLAIGIYMIKQNGISGWLSTATADSMIATHEEILKGGLSVNAFGFYPDYILNRLAQIFLLNFNWIPTVIILSSFGFSLKKKRRKKWNKISNLEDMTGALILFVLFSVFYITESLARYTIFSTVILWILGMILLYYIAGPVLLSKKKLLVTLSIMAVCLCIQNVWYIDPVSNLIFKRVESGKGKVLSVNMEDKDGCYYGDTLVNNYRYRYLDSLLDEMLRQEQYGIDKQIVLWPSSMDQSYINTLFWYEIGWDTNKQKRVIITEEETSVILLNMIDLEAVQSGVPLAGETILYFLPYYEYDEEAYVEQLKEYYDVSERKEASNWGGELSYYILRNRV